MAWWSFEKLSGKILEDFRESISVSYPYGSESLPVLYLTELIMRHIKPHAD